MRLLKIAVCIAALAGENGPAHAQSVEHVLRPPNAMAHAWSPTLLVREQPSQTGDRSHPVLYVHGATFPSALSMMFRFEGSSWADNLTRAGFDVFALDFAGYGGSERYPAMMTSSDVGAPLGRAPEAAAQIQRAVSFILSTTGAPKVDIIAHSWGTIPTGLFAGQYPDQIGKLVLFGPIAQRTGSTDRVDRAWDLVTVAQQHARFVRSVPAGEPGVLLETDFPSWAETYLGSDPTSSTRNPPSVKVPAGPSADIADAWSGSLGYDPSKIKAPTLIIRGEWDTTSPDADMAWLEAHLTHARAVRAVKAPRATHLMHLEQGRTRLYEAVEHFLSDGLR